MSGDFLGYLGVGTVIKARHVENFRKQTASVSPGFFSAVAANLLNPHPWLFWMTVGGPTVVRSWRFEPMHALAFTLGFYLLLVGSKIGVAWLLARTRGRLSLNWYKRLLVVCGVILAAIGFLFIAGPIVTGN